MAVLVGAGCVWSASGNSKTSNIGYVRAGALLAAAVTPEPTETQTPAPTVTATETTTPDADLTPAQPALLDHVPSEIADSCTPLTDVEDDFAAATSSLGCRITDQVSVDYYQFDSRADLDAVWDRRKPTSATADSCTDLNWEGTWYRDDPSQTSGRMQCWGLEDFAAVEWTHDALLAYGEAFILARRPKTLYRAWVKAGLVE
jgi:hypothetical protein